MKLLLLLSFSLIASRPQGAIKTAAAPPQKSCIESFKHFRDALYQNDLEALKSFFTFPIMNPSNEVWYLVLDEKELQAKKLEVGQAAPFTEKDFERYYKKLFPKSFVNRLLKIKSVDLFASNEAESPALKEGRTAVKLYASVDENEMVLTLNLSYSTAWKEKNGEAVDGGESNVIYTFNMLYSGKLHFMNVQLAG